MTTRKHNCPYLHKKKYCSHKASNKLRSRTKKIYCSHKNCEDCILWKKSPSEAERLILGSSKRLRDVSGEEDDI